MIQSEYLKRVSKITHGFGLRGVVLEEYLAELGLENSRQFQTNQVHSNRVHCLGSKNKDEFFEGDAFITNEPNVVCYVRTADCASILIVDPKQRAVAAVHAGWRGTACDVTGAAMREMSRVFGANPKDCIAAIGPRICGKCCEVGDEVIQKMKALKIGNDWLLENKHVDLGIANKELLMRAGISKSNIELLPHCTFCDEKFASYRRDHSETERQVNFIVISRFA